MAILIRKNGSITYKGYRIWKTEYQEKADNFDDFIKNEIKRIEKEVYSLGYLKEGGLKDNKCHYWIGVQLKNIKFHESLHETDRPWVIDALEYHAPYNASPISGKNRDQKWRRVYNYDMLLAEVPSEDVEILNWGEWSTIFDSYAFHYDSRAMAWLKENLSKIEKLRKRNVIRKFALAMNKDFCKKNRDLSYLTDKEFLKEINTVFEKFLEDNSEILNS